MGVWGFRGFGFRVLGFWSLRICWPPVQPHYGVSAEDSGPTPTKDHRMTPTAFDPDKLRFWVSGSAQSPPEAKVNPNAQFPIPKP